MHRYIETPRPLLTSRVEFALLPAPAPAALASRTEFTDARLAYPNSAERPVNDRESPSPALQPARRNLRSGGKIAKPPGEPGRPKSGGFTLETALKGIGWMRDDVEALTVCKILSSMLPVTDPGNRRLSERQRGKSLTLANVIASRTELR